MSFVGKWRVIRKLIDILKVKDSIFDNEKEIDDRLPKNNLIRKGFLKILHWIYSVCRLYQAKKGNYF